MQNPRKLKVREEARALAVATCRLTTGFPNHERFALASQMQRAAVSAGSNISEGCGGPGDRAMLAYLHHAVGSLNELEFHLEIATGLGFGASDESAALLWQVNTTRRTLLALVQALRRRAVNKT